MHSSDIHRTDRNAVLEEIKSERRIDQFLGFQQQLLCCQLLDFCFL